MLFIAWLYGEQNQVRPMFPPNTSTEDLVRASKSFDLAQQLPPVDWSTALWHLPEMDIIKAVDQSTGGNCCARSNDFEARIRSSVEVFGGNIGDRKSVV